MSSDVERLGESPEFVAEIRRLAELVPTPDLKDELLRLVDDDEAKRRDT